MNAQKLRGRENILSARIASIFVLATLLLPTHLAQAVPITIEITGEITSVGGDVGSIPSTIYAGVSFTGTYTYDSSTLDSDASLYIGEYEHNSPYGISLLLGGYEFKTAANHIGKFHISIKNDDPQVNLWDYYMVESDEIISDPPVGFSVGHIRWVLGDITHTALGSDALPATAPVLTDWGYNALKISGSGDLGNILIEGTVTQAVPEPLTGVLMLIGVFFLKRRGKAMKAQKLRGREKILSARIAPIFVLATLLLSAPLAKAVPITIEITGEVTSASGSGLPGTIYAGIGFTGTYTYDSSAPDSSASSYIGLYVFDSPYGMNISLGGIEFETSPSHIGQFEIKISDNGPNLDYYTVWSNQNTPLSDGTTISWISWGVYGPNEMLSSTDLPITAPVIDQWDNRLFIYGRDIYGNGYDIYGIVSQAVPEPLTGVLMIIGVLFFKRRR